ncbi:hypothetical protein RF55_12448 [Lasius niger]|uniref:Uncharacterized protein n=1 Tax=Lasius niger TaxID=67767 RepID=A0A0J7KD59_LASNI|nr:hypothetical protein RF55_12448 [Lasius niger]
METEQEKLVKRKIGEDMPAPETSGIKKRKKRRTISSYPLVTASRGRDRLEDTDSILRSESMASISSLAQNKDKDEEIKVAEGKIISSA